MPHRSTLLGAEGVKARTQGQQQVTISAELERKIINRAAKRDVIDSMPRIQKSGFFNKDPQPFYDAHTQLPNIPVSNPKIRADKIIVGAGDLQCSG